MTLSDLTVRQAKAAERTYSIPDTDGLGLVVARTGGKSWHLRYYWLGKQKRISLGNYPEIGLREARTLRDEARALLAKGVNPIPIGNRSDTRSSLRPTTPSRPSSMRGSSIAARKSRRAGTARCRRSCGSSTRTCCLASSRCRSTTFAGPNSWASWRGSRSARRSPLPRRSAPGWGSCSAMPSSSWRAGSQSGLRPGRGGRTQAPGEPQPLPASSGAPEFLHKLRLYNPRGWQTQLGIRLLFLTGVRTGELRLATPDQFDLDRGLWIIPPQIVKQLQDEMRKAGKRPQDVPPYIVPLSVQAIEIVRYLLGVMRPAQVHLLTHRSELKKRISENTLNAALKRMGYEDQLTGHGIRGTISTALNEIGYPKIWVDAQLSHSDPNKVSSAYNHAKYVEPRRRMMQDWADRLDLLEQGQVEAASAHLTIHIEGVPAMAEEDKPNTIVAAASAASVPPVVAEPIVVTPNDGGITFQRLSQVPPPPTHAPEPEVSVIQREREEMLAIYESPSSLPVPLFGKLAGKSKDQINRELKAGKLLSISLGNRGQRVPDWQLVPLKHKLAQVLMNQCPHADPWDLYRMLTRPHPDLGDRAAIDIVTPGNLGMVVRVIAGTQQQPNRPGPDSSVQGIPEETRQRIQRLLNDAAMLESA